MPRSLVFWTGVIANMMPVLVVSYMAPDVDRFDDEDPNLDALVQSKAVDGWVPVGHICGPLENSDSRERWADYARSVVDHAEDIGGSLDEFGLKRGQVSDLRAKVLEMIMTLRNPEPVPAPEPVKVPDLVPAMPVEVPIALPKIEKVSK